MARLTLALVLGLAVGCGRPARAPVADAANAEARSLLCADVGEAACLSACPDTLDRDAHAACLVRFRFASDPRAAALASSLYAKKRVLVGLNPQDVTDGYHGERIPLYPALPLGAQRHHLKWLASAFDRVENVLDGVSALTGNELAFERHPRAVAFFQTASPRFPSAYCWGDVIYYNLEGPLHANASDVADTLVHELFHLSDSRRDWWSEQTLVEVYTSITARCQQDHECLARFAPHPSLADGGTFYAFDARTGDVREYAAEIALRYFVEHEAYLAGATPAQPPFKCEAPENLTAWDLVAGEFFGGVDLSPDCSEGAP